VRAAGARAATIGFVAGELVGASESQIEHLATAQGVRKVGRRELPFVLAPKLDSLTEVRRHECVLTESSCPPIMSFARCFHGVSRQHHQCAGS